MNRSLRLFLGMLMILAAATVSAFPPAPYHLIYGTIRDELGNPLAPGNAQATLETTSGSILRASIRSHGAGVNYQIRVPMDSGMTSRLYQPTAMFPFAPFLIKVKIGTEIFLPIEMTANFSRLGEPGQETRLDLTLGVDSDGDGIPDAWERALAVRSGRTPNLADITPGGDIDNDGLSNLNEYYAGTRAYDPREGFNLKIGPDSSLEFLAIRGRAYSILGSVNLENWIPVTFILPDAPGETATALAVNTANLKVVPVLPADSAPYRFFKLLVQ